MSLASEHSRPSKTVWVFAHGWAETARDWLPLLRALQAPPEALKTHHEVVVLDAYAPSQLSNVMQYHAKDLVVRENALVEKYEERTVEWIGVGHSLGFSKLLAQPLPWAKLVSLHGFTRFTADADIASRRTGTAPRILERMIKQFKRNPGQVIRDFRQRSGHRLTDEAESTSPLKLDTLDYETLLRDLEYMLHLDARENLIACLQQGTQILSVSSPKDDIVPTSLSTDNFGPDALLAGGAPISNLQQAAFDASHAGPMIQPDLYTAVLREFSASPARPA